LNNENLRSDYNDHPINKHLNKLNACIIKEGSEKLQSLSPVKFENEKMGLSGLSGLGLHFLSSITNLNSNYYGAVGVYQ
jgi:hypothetical protein